jgi:hypothetical protein
VSVPEAADPHVGETRISLQLNEEDEEAWQRGQDFVAVGSVKPAIATLDLHVISVPKAKKKPKKKSKK